MVVDQPVFWRAEFSPPVFISIKAPRAIGIFSPCPGWKNSLGRTGLLADSPATAGDGGDSMAHRNSNLQNNRQRASPPAGSISGISNSVNIFLSQMKAAGGCHTSIVLEGVRVISRNAFFASSSVFSI